MHLTYYRAGEIARYQSLPGIKKFLSFFGIYHDWVCPIDRTVVLRTPVRTKSLFPMPQMRILNKDYEQICNERANELLIRAERLDVPIYVFWSGGVDSTCLLVSLLKNATQAQKD